MIDKNRVNGNPLALVVDDDNSLRIAMGAALMKVGFDVIEAENGHRALHLFRSEKPDLVLLDVVMPEMDGFETCDAIRKLPEGAYTQVLMVTGLDDIDSTRRAFEVGADGFVSKPVNLVMLGHRGRYMLRAGQAFRELYRSKNRLAKTQKLAKLGNWQVDLATNDFHCSHEASRLLGLNGDGRQVTYDDFLAQIIGHERDTVRKKIEKAVKAKKSINLDYRVLLADGTQKHILNRGEVLFNEDGVPEILLGVIQDVTQLKQAEEEIRMLAFYDGLTGLANRMLFRDRLDQAIATAMRKNQIFALLYLDLDKFKRVNDTLGHPIGDLLLKNVAETLKQNIRRSDTATRPGAENSDSIIARLGGDEFIVLLSDIRDTESAAMIARRLIKAIPATYNCDGHDVSVTTSIGISVFPQDGEDPDVLLKNADSAMYQAKDSGRNNYQFYEESLNLAAIERFSIEKDIRKALDKEEFVLYYQPQVDLATRKIVGAEALIRWIHPEKGMVPPDDFIQIAEESDLIIDINKWVLQTACKQGSEWKKAGFSPMKVSVNLSGYKFASQNIVESIKDVLKTVKLEGQDLEIEITENVLMQDTDDTISTLKQMKALCLTMTLDDFGTGFSSLRYLTSFPFDAIKIDRSFVMECIREPDNLVIIRTIIAMGHSLEKRIVAEGIETKEQFDLLKSYGCDEAQGYYFSRPVPQDEFTELLVRGVL
ncbi:MAG: EAL domain-containing protein [Syntrophobacterales bacterium]|nr:MAG: EAL domain-containing protein [Syntrophobacterales bacterium]